MTGSTCYAILGRLKEAAIERSATQMNPRRSMPADAYALSKNLSNSKLDSSESLWMSFVTANPAAVPVASR